MPLSVCHFVCLSIFIRQKSITRALQQLQLKRFETGHSAIRYDVIIERAFEN